MSTIELDTIVTSLQEWEAILEDAKAEVDSLKDTIKRELDSRGVDGTHIIRWTTVTSNRLDTTAMKKAVPEVYAHFLHQTTSRRFSIS